MLKVGAKEFTPKQLRKDYRPKSINFNWDDFHHRQKRRLKDLQKKNNLSVEELTKNITAKLAPEDTKYPTSSNLSQQQLIKLKLAKSLLYRDWKWKASKNNEFVKYLFNSKTGQKIKIYYRTADNKLIISASKKDMQDSNVLAIMLELSREAQRMSNQSHKSVHVSGLSEQEHSVDQKIIEDINLLAESLNQGIATAKKPEDQEKTFKIEIDKPHKK